MKRIALILICLIAIPLALAQTQEEASTAINEANASIQEMKEAGFNTQRVEDILSETNQIFVAQVALEETGESPNYRLITERTEQIIELKKKAFEVNDEITALDLRINELKDVGVDTAELFDKLEEIRKEFRSERYENAAALIEELYGDISEAQASVTKVKAIYEASRKTIKGFIEDNWKELLIALVVVTISTLILQSEVRIALIKRKKKRLLIERDVLLDLIKKAQKTYFEKGTMSEGEYAIKISKFRELIRDINRQLPILDELLAKRKSFFKKLSFKKEGVKLEHQKLPAHRKLKKILKHRRRIK